MSQLNLRDATSERPTIHNKGRKVKIDILPLLIQSTTTLASISISTARMLRDRHKSKPSLRAQSSASTLVATPILRVNPLTQPPWASLINPPPPALPGLPKDEPSVFNLAHLELGLDQHTLLTSLVTALPCFPAQNMYSVTAWTIKVLLRSDHTTRTLPTCRRVTRELRDSHDPMSI